MSINSLSNTDISVTEKLNNKKSQSQNLPQISVIIPVFNSVDFLEDCLDSIYNSSGNIKIEVLIGIDSSVDDLKWFENNHQKYNGLHVFWFNQNVGPYVVKNTLVDFAKSENILFFDSDDIMNKNMISDYLNSIKNNLIVRFKYIEFTEKSELNNKNLSRNFADSAFGIRKTTFNKLNGFEPWKSSADVEFHYRLKANKISSKNLEFASFYKRIHKNSLSLKLNQENKPIRQDYIILLNKKLRTKSWNFYYKKTFNCLKVEDYSSVLKIQTNLSSTSTPVFKKSSNLTHSNTSIKANINQKISNIKNNIKENEAKNTKTLSNNYISIIIPAFKASEFLDDCLTSIINQSFKKIEILLGIDACQETLDWAIKNKDKYADVSFFYFKNNIGPYLIKNTLANIASYENILFFDADDIMHQDLLLNVAQHIKNNTIVKIKFSNFQHNDGIKSASSFKWLGEGVFAIKKRDFIKLNGFEPWKCAADTEFQLRSRHNNMSFVNAQKSFFYRRIHSNNLTVNPVTNGRSKIRKEYIQKIEAKQKNKNWKLSEFKTTDTEKIFTNNNLIEDNNISIIIPAWQASEFIDECIDSIKKQKKSNINIEILLGIDNCNKTLEHIKNNKEKYNDIKVYWFNENLGPYIVRNTLLSEAKYDKIVFFDADDIMHEDMLITLNKYIQPNKIIKFKYYHFYDNNKIDYKDDLPINLYSHGQFAITKKTFLRLNGFEAWKCAADTEFHIRAEKNNIDIVSLTNKLFFRRNHSNSITSRSETDRNSKLRKSYKNIINNKKIWTLNTFNVSKNYNMILFENNYINLVVSRVCVKWLQDDTFMHENLGMDWNSFVKLSINLYDNYLRKSLSKQTNQNFKLISLFDKDICSYGNILNNEIILKVDDHSSILSTLKEYIKSNYGEYKYVLLTRIDRDDAVDLNFVDLLQNNVNNFINKSTPYYFDIMDHIMYDVHSQNCFEGGSFKTNTSPFISVLEDINELNAYPYALNHAHIKNMMPGIKLSELKALQIIHDKNLKNRIQGKKIKFDINNFGII